MSEFEQFDDQLAGALQSRAGSGITSVAAAHDAVLGRASHIRRRRAATVGGVAMIALLIGGVALVPRGGGDTLAPSDTGDVLPSVDVDSTIEEADEVGTDSTIDEIVDAEIDDNSSSSATDDSVNTTVDTVVLTTKPAAAPVTTDTSVTGTTVAGGTNSSGSGTTPSSGSTGSSVTASSPSTTQDQSSSSTSPDSSTSTSEPGAPPIQPFTKTYPSIGGSITVSWNGSAFSLVAIAPAQGFEPEVENQEPLRIRVRFRSNDADSRIEVRISDGQLVEIIS